MKIAIFGCRKISVDIIKHIIDNSNHEIVLVINYDEERDKVYDPILVGEYCREVGVPTIYFGEKDKIDSEAIRSAKPDVILSIYYRKMLGQEILDIPPMGCINIHPAPLPKYRGPAPSLWNILNGDKEAGITIHYMVDDVDAGDIIDRRIIEIGERTGFELNRDLMDLGFQLFKDNFISIMAGTNKRVPQKQEEATYCLPFKKNIRYVYWNDPDEILRRVKAFAKPYDGAITYSNKATIVIWKAKVLNIRDSLKPPGFFNKVDNGSLVIQTCTLPIVALEWELVSGNLGDTGRFISGPLVV